MNSQITTAAAPRPMRLVAAATALAMSVMSFGTISSAAPAAGADELVDVIVRAQAGATDSVRSLVKSLGGSVELDLSIINGFSADVPADAVARLVADSSVLSVTPDVKVRLQARVKTKDVVVATETEKLEVLDTMTGEFERVSAVESEVLSTSDVLYSEAVTGAEVVAEAATVSLPGPGDLNIVNASIQADQLHAQGITGEGVDVALIDSGIVPVDGLTVGDNVSFGPDLSFEAGFAPVTNLDTFGHGTHMAGIIAGDGSEITGVAPGSRIISVKVADATGATDVSQVIAGIDWVVQNRNTDGRNIRVLNLSFGTDGAQPYEIDPLAYAVEVAWNNDIVVVAAAGNHGDTLGRLANPAIDPFVIAVAATDTHSTVSTDDDSIPSWSAVGNRERYPDIAAPGRSIASLRSPGSWVDVANPAARLGETLMKGSGTSQAAAVTSGAVALMLQAEPELTAGEVKFALMKTANKIRTSGSQRYATGKGTIQVADAINQKTNVKKGFQKFDSSDGSGSLEAARGSYHVTDADGNELTGEMTVNGVEWTGSTWAGSTWAGSTWAGSTWAGSTWAGSTWAGSTWAGSTWAGSTWAGSTWAGSTWAGSTWASSTSFWSGLRWE